MLYGLQKPEPNIKDWSFLGYGNVLNPARDWSAYLPQLELQNLGVETNNCTAYGTLNALETLLKQRGIAANYSERYLGIVAGTTDGNDPNTVAEAVRHFGVIDEDLLPWDKPGTIEEYWSPKPMTNTLLNEGKKWLKQFTFKHYWVFDTEDPLEVKRQKIKDALLFSPLGISVYAWISDGPVYIKPGNTVDNHWCVLYGYNNDGTWNIFDSYDYSHKILDKDFNFDMAKLYNVNNKKQNCVLKYLGL